MKKNLINDNNNRQIARDLYYFKDLLVGIRAFESSVGLEPMRKLLRYTDSSKSLLIKSSVEIYRSASIYLLSAKYDRSTSYHLQGLEGLLDNWFINMNQVDAKRKIVTSDILILHGKRIVKSHEALIRTLIEIIEIRKATNKPTWIFLQGDSNNNLPDIEEAYKLIEPHVTNKINY